jgi:predicted RNase H-like nuclease
MGVDGCPGGWFVVQLNQSDAWKTALATTGETLARYIKQSQLTLIDIPIGLPDTDTSQRECDLLARKALAMPRAASVFPVPSRAAVYANSYVTACELNQRSLGKKLSKQTWNICAKIRQVDELLHNNRFLCNKLRESHPEVCFWALNNKNAMRFSKKSKAGREERMQVLIRYLPAAHDILEFAANSYRRNQVAVDDIIDAMALALTTKVGHKKLNSFPLGQRLDMRDLPMEIVYWEPL